MDEFEKLLESVRKRDGNIKSADRYLSAFSACFGGEQCNPLCLGITESSWQSAMKEAASKLVYSDAEMIIHGGHVLTGEAHSFGQDKKDRKDRIERTNAKNAIMVFDACITSTKQDRDGDVLESEGATVEAHVLLWQHLPIQPIGSYLGTLSQSKSRLTGSCAIADVGNGLGEDAAMLVEMGALGISHGFRPIKFSPLSDKKVENLSDDVKPGWHIEKFSIYEVSLVSVESNTDAAILAFSRNKLHHPLNKAWAGGMFNKRNKIVVSGYQKPPDGFATIEKFYEATEEIEFRAA